MVRTITCLVIAALGAAAQNFADVRPSPQQLAWQDLEIGVLIHFGPNSFMDREWGDGTADASVFNPPQLDAEQWVKAAKAGGAKYFVMVAKHHDGFCLWPSRWTKYSVASSPWRGGKGDLIREVEQACKKHGLKFGVYLSPWDRHEPAYKDNAKYDEYYVRQLTELATRYGPLTEFWLDGAGSEGHVYDFLRYIRTLRVYQPNAMIFASVDFLPHADIRWVGNEDGSAPEENWNVIDAYQVVKWRPAEADTPLRHGHWFWHPNAESKLKSLDELKHTYHVTVGRGAQLVLGLAPDNRGLLPEVDVKRLEEFGVWLRETYGRNLALKRCSDPRACDGDPETFVPGLADGNQTTIEISFEGPQTVDRVLSMEHLAAGQRIREWELRAETASGMKTIAKGTTVGHKRIDQFPPVTASRFLFVVLSSLDAPRVAELQLYLGKR
jgi:alpha-L-fucosidase